MKVTGHFDETRGLYPTGRIGLVPTMGFLHEGHISLLKAARNACDLVVMSLYVNGLQFGDPSDLAEYPRDRERDLGLAAEAGVDVVFAPDDATMYPDGDETRVSVPSVAATMEGEFRPGHFEGVATVVAKLFAGLQPDMAFFGMKDAQQLAVVTRMAEDLAMPVEVVGLPIVRESDGLALSSRNVRLDPDLRDAALSLSRGLFAAAERAEAGELDGPSLEEVAMDAMEAAALTKPEYATLAGSADAERIPRLDRPAFLAVAAGVGSVRLIDNIHFSLEGTRVVADRGVVITRTSMLYEGAPRRADTITGGGSDAAGS